ncbi:MbcA/ParS/Xre antitoxin family protein [Marinobacter sp.]|jgi:hypothetical protein|uniref:MbcA/ParS/Xre antitoxin family protein n=2 Tax=unclassified Marinobacter TaxID=83889 RepID=UPI000C48F50F|nr:hypothetical protein [Marinobacter sp.]MAK49703.1 hypothetical protein [Marinobacter sp.]MAO26140.1 hypothetical protein [Roseovarius sp.]
MAPENPSTVLAKATMRAAFALDINEMQLARILGVDEKCLGTEIDPASWLGQRAQKLIRIYQYLSARAGNDDAGVSQWMRTSNRRFGCSPRERLQKAEGLDEVMAYLESLL